LSREFKCGSHWTYAALCMTLKNNFTNKNKQKLLYKKFLHHIQDTSHLWSVLNKIQEQIIYDSKFK